MAKSECALCRGKRSEFVCAQCASDMLQQRRTMLAALQADVAVLRHKTEASLGGKSRLLKAERQLDERMRRVEALAEKVMKAREQLCSERIALVERTSRLEERARVVAASQQRALAARQQAEGWHLPVLESLDFQVQWAHENAAKGRGEKIRELYALFALTPDDQADDEDEGDDEDDLLGDAKPTPPSMDQGAKREPRPVYFRAISGMPLPISGRYANMPPEVAAAALGQVIHLLQCLVKYLKLTYPHPMVFNGSFSTIGNTSEGAGCHTLYPDGSPGFARAVEMLHENVAFLCATQGVSRQAVHPTDLLANLLQVYRSPRLGTLSDDADVASTCRSASSRATAATSASPENSQALSSSIEILPHYS